jgi:hypothetical protein
MQFTRIVGKFGLYLALGFAGFVVGCGSQEGSTAISKEEGKTIKEQRKQDRQQIIEERKGANAGNPRRGRDR